LTQQFDQLEGWVNPVNFTFGAQAAFNFTVGALGVNRGEV
jgi:hypothetical protein